MVINEGIDSEPALMAGLRKHSRGWLPSDKEKGVLLCSSRAWIPWIKNFNSANIQSQFSGGQENNQPSRRLRLALDRPHTCQKLTLNVCNHPKAGVKQRSGPDDRTEGNLSHCLSDGRATIRKHPANELKSLLCWRNGKTSATYIINEIHWPSPKHNVNWSKKEGIKS